MSKAEVPKQGSAPCHACLLRADNQGNHNARSSWRRICDECADKFVTNPLPVPSERVRLCPDNFGVWGQSREIYQSWDTGRGTVVPARKYNLSPASEGKVAIVLQDAADAQTIDRLLGPLSKQPDRPFMLRYCSSIKSFCAESCFSSSRDKSCMAHIKQRLRPADKPRCELQNAELRGERGLAEGTDDLTDDWLFSEIAGFGDDDGGDDEWSSASAQLADICELTKPPPERGIDFATSIAACLQAPGAPPPPTHSSSSDTASTSSAPDSPSHTGGPSSFIVSEQDNILDSLSTLLGSDDNSAIDEGAFWASTVDMLDAPFTSGVPLRKSVPTGPKPKPWKPVVANGPGPAIAKPQWGKTTGATPQRPPKPATFAKMHTLKVPAKPSQSPMRTKCVWKQQVTW